VSVGLGQNILKILSRSVESGPWIFYGRFFESSVVLWWFRVVSVGRVGSEHFHNLSWLVKLTGFYWVLDFCYFFL
jgi:hypothetical protein